MTAPLVLPARAEPRLFRKEGLAFVFDPTKGGEPLGIRFRVERLKVETDRLWGLLTVTTTHPGARGLLLGPLGHNFLASPASVVKELVENYEPSTLDAGDWRDMLQALRGRLLEASQSRARIEELGAQDLAPRSPDLVEKLIQAGQQTILFGPGGAGKGWLAIALALCCRYGIPFCGLTVQQAEVLYLDAEADRETFLARVKAVARGLGLGSNSSLLRAELIGAGSLGANLEQLSVLCADHGAGLVIHDSVGKLSVPVGQHTNFEGSAKEYDDATSLLGPGLAHLLIDHVSGEGMREKLAGKAINSARKMFNARVGWEARQAQEAESDTLSVGLYHAKRNNTRYFSPIGIRLDFESDPYGRAICVRFHREDVRDNAELAERMAQPQQALALLRRGGLWTTEVADGLGIERHHASKVLRRLEARGDIQCLAQGAKGAKKWGLKSGETGDTLYTYPPVSPSFRCGEPRAIGDTVDTSGETVSPQNGRPSTPRPWWNEQDEEPDDAPF